MYTNVDGALMKKMKGTDNIKEEEPRVICLSETKLNSDIDSNGKDRIQHLGERLRNKRLMEE